MPVISFQPIYQERVWGGRKLETHYHRSLPQKDTPYGESWELSDRVGAQSITTSGPYEGETLHDLWTHHRDEIFGKYANSRFPLLIKILDARQDLSLQVHPPQHLASQLNGEPKTEMWYIAHAEPGATIYVGLKEGTTREAFESALKNGTPDKLVHTIKPKSGDSIHIPSGRLHAIGAGLVIYEIQQNSDTTYRVFDWNRAGADGKLRELHIEESMQCIDFEDFEPRMDTPTNNTLAKCPFYKVDKFLLKRGETIQNPDTNKFSIITVVSGTLVEPCGKAHREGSFILLSVGEEKLVSISENTVLLQTTIPSA